MPGIVVGVNVVYTLCNGCVMQSIAKTAKNCSGLRFRDDILSLAGITLAGSAKADQKKMRLI